jgi:hypothetical protein
MDAAKDWRSVHERLLALNATRSSLDYEEARLLAAAKRLAVHVHFGYASLLEYVIRTLGLEAKMARERLRVADALEDLPLTAAALREGKLSWSGARELTRVAVRDTEAEWLDAARDRTVRQIEDMISGALPGSRPGDERNDDAVRHALHFEVSGATLALWREAQTQLTRDTSGSLDDDALLQLMARRILGHADEGRASYQIAVTLCDRCKRGKRGGIAMTKSEVAQAECDAQRIGDSPRATQDVTPATRRKVLARDGARCVVDGCAQAAWVDVHHLTLKSEGGGHDADNLATFCAAHHTAVHEGRLVVEGRPSTGLTFRHADGTIYGRCPSPAASTAAADTFLALKTLGYKEKEARWAIGRIMPHVGHDATLEDLIRRALAALRESS